jgi:aminopeptidase N
MKKFTFYILLSSLAWAAQAQTMNTHDSYVRDKSKPREHPVDFTKMTLNVNIIPEKGLVKGKVTHQFVPIQQQVDSIFFDGPGIKIISALLNGTPVEFATQKEGITIFPKGLQWDKSYTLVFEYEANPKKGIYFIGWNNESAETHLNELGHTRKQVWTQGQGIDNRHWIPCYDEPNDKVITETFITFNKDYKVLSNGLLVGETNNADQTKTWHYQMSKPHASYLIMIGIDKYGVKKTKSKRGVPVQFWYYPEFADRLETSSLYTEQMIDFMEEELGVLYPWESYSQVMVQDFIYGAMENTTATIFGDFFNVDARAFLDRNYIGVNMHEFTHQWFGDYISALHYSHQWLQESFATHYPKYFYKKIYGDDYFQWERRNELNSIIEADKKDRLPVVSLNSGGARIYQKGSSILDMLRYVLGNEQYRRVIKYYLNKHAYGNVETNDLERAVHECLGITLDWFFDEWLYRGGMPTYDVKWESLSGQTRVTINQTQQIDDVVGYFKMPTTIEVYYRDGSKSLIKQMTDGKTTIIDIANASNKEVAFVLFDPQCQIVKQLNMNRTYNELEAQATMSENMIDRYDAIIALKETEVNIKRSLLQDRYRKEIFFGIKAEILKQLAKDSDPSSLSLINEGLQSNQVQIRTAAFNALDKITEERRELVEKLLKDSSYNLVEKSLEKLSFEYPQNISQYLELTKNDIGMANQVRIKWLEIAIRSGKKGQIASLIHYSSADYEFRTRILAFNALKALGYMDTESCKNMFQAMTSWNGRLAAPASDVYNYLTTQTIYKKLAADTYKDLNADLKKELDQKGIKF